MGLKEYFVEIEDTSNLEGILEMRKQTQLPDDRTIYRKITDIYFASKSFERNGTIYEYLGIKPFKKLLWATVGKIIKKETPSNYNIGRHQSLEALTNFENKTRLNESIHAPQIIWNITSMINAIERNDYVSTSIIGLALFVNTYCTMLQRYHRAKLEPIIMHKKLAYEEAKR